MQTLGSKLQEQGLKEDFSRHSYFWFRQLVARYFPLNDAFFGYDIALILAREVLNVVEIKEGCRFNCD